MLLGLDDARARTSRFRCRELNLPHALARFTAFSAQRGEFGHAPDIALTPGGNAVTDPMFFGGDLAVLFVALALFFFQELIAPSFITFKASIETEGAAAIEPHRGACEILQKPPVMTDQHQRAAHLR